VRGRGGRAAAVGGCGFNGFRYEVEKEGEEGESVGRYLMRGGIKEVWMALHFLYRGAREGTPWRRAARRRRPSRRRLGRLRWEKTPGWAEVGCACQQAIWAGARFLDRTDFGLR
jgi:hypothetical protein